MNRVLLSTLVAAAAFASLPSQAVVVSFGSTNTNVVGGDQSGKTSPFLGAANVQTGNVFIETFDARNGGGNSQGCGLDTPPGLVEITGGTYGFRRGSVSGAASPAGDSTCFAYGPSIGGPLPDTVTLNYTGLLSTLSPGASLDYLGLYYGSIDTYNDLVFYDANGNIIQTITGTSLITAFNGQSGNQQADSSNIYVNLAFTPGEQFTSFAFTTSNIAFEMDNVAVGFNATAVPEPGSLALLGLGLAAAALARKKTRKQI
jgi:hypothetical protein